MAAQPSQDVDDEAVTVRCCAPLRSLTQPVEVDDIESSSSAPFFKWPLLGPLIFVNESSDARDHCANERTFLSYLRLSVYMAIVSVAITASFHIKGQPSDIERRMAKPLGAVFWLLSVLTLMLGVGNYIKTVNLYSRKAAIVQSGWKTQLVLGGLAFCIIGTCIILLVVDKVRQN